MKKKGFKLNVSWEEVKSWSGYILFGFLLYKIKVLNDEMGNKLVGGC